MAPLVWICLPCRTAAVPGSGFCFSVVRNGSGGCPEWASCSVFLFHSRRLSHHLPFAFFLTEKHLIKPKFFFLLLGFHLLVFEAQRFIQLVIRLLSKPNFHACFRINLEQNIYLQRVIFLHQVHHVNFRNLTGIWSLVCLCQIWNLFSAFKVTNVGWVGQRWAKEICEIHTLRWRH